MNENEIQSLEYDCFSNTSLTLLKDVLKANAKLTIQLAQVNREKQDLEKQLKELQAKMKGGASDGGKSK